MTSDSNAQHTIGQTIFLAKHLISAGKLDITAAMLQYKSLNNSYEYLLTCAHKNKHNETTARIRQLLCHLA